MKPEIKLACLSGLAVMLGGMAEAQGIPQRVAALERKVASLNRTVASLKSDLSALSSRLDLVNYQLRFYSATVDCDAGQSLAAALLAPATAPTVQVTVSGTCHEVIEIHRDHVSIQGQPGATIDAPAGSAWGIFVNGGQDVRIDQLTVKGAPTSIHVRHAHLEGSALNLYGGVTALMGSTVRLYPSVLIQGAPYQGVDIDEESSFTIFGCQIRDAGYAGVRVVNGTFSAENCQIERSGQFGILAQGGANVSLEEVNVTDSGTAGVSAGLGSAVLIQTPGWSNGGAPLRSRITGSPVGLQAAGGSSVRLGHVTIQGNGDGVSLGDASVVERDMFGQLQVTGNSAAGVRCAPAPAVPQLVLVDSSSVFGNPGGDIVCAGY